MRTTILLTLGILLFLASAMPPGIAQTDNSVSLSTDGRVHGLGRSVPIVVVYRGATHGDLKLQIKDATGSIVKEWSWSHLSGDMFQQSVSHTFSKAGAYAVEANHVGHHGEPPARSSTPVAVWSARIDSVDYPAQANATQPVTVNVKVSFSFTEQANIMVGVWNPQSNDWLANRNDNLAGQGSRTYTFQLTAPTVEQAWNPEARVQYQAPGGDWLTDASGSTKQMNVTVVAEFSTPAFAVLILLVSAAALLRKSRH